MNNKDFKNLQNSLYNNILPPTESLKHSHGKGFDAHKPLNHTPDLSDSEHTQSSQTRSDERFRMTEKFPLSLGEGWGEGWHWQKALKTVALTLALSFFIVAPAMAQAPTPTLDNLHNQDITMPDSTEKYPESAYTLTEIENADPENLPENAITLYDKTEVTKYYDPSTGEEVAESDRQEGVEYKEVTTIETTPKYYTVSLKQTAYGDPNGTTTLIYVWEKNADTGNLEFKQDPTAPVGQTITYKYIIPDGTSLSRRENTTDNSSETITGVFLNQTSSQFGGAISNNGSSAKLGDINANFIGNYLSSNSDIYGGAIYNSSGTIGDIIGDFIGNYAVTSAAGLFVVANGGAIYNSGIIGDITGDFIGNYTYSNNYVSEGGAIYNDGTIGDITGNFIGNYAASSTDYIRHLHGGAIYNSNTIRNITGDFIGNYASTTDVSANGGAIYNAGTIGDITGDFIGNYASSTDGSAYGGAIYNDSGTIGDITGDFIGNYVSSNSSSANGGAIYNSGTIGNITGDFIGNYVSSTDSSTYGGAIYDDL